MRNPSGCPVIHLTTPSCQVDAAFQPYRASQICSGSCREHRTKLAEQLAYPAFDLVAHGPDGFEALAGGVVEVPVEVPLAGEDRAGVAAAHGDHDIGGADHLVGPGFGELAGDVDAPFSHRGDGGRVDLRT